VVKVVSYYIDSEPVQKKARSARPAGYRKAPYAVVLILAKTQDASQNTVVHLFLYLGGF
jgi:hypothetical protein